MTRTYYIASDVHLGAVPDETERSFLRFLEHVGEVAHSLLLPGDLFDFWFEWGATIPGKHFRVLAALSSLVDAGIPVTMVGGNHDVWGGRFLRDEVGIDFHGEPVTVEIAGRPALVAHGDGLGRGDLRYRMLRLLLRSRPTVAGFRMLHPELGLRVARAVSSTEGKAGTGSAEWGPHPTRRASRGDPGRARFIEDWARQQLRAEPGLGWVVCGHAHVPAVTSVAPGQYYLNAGDWVRHSSYITVSPAAEPALHRWEQDPE